MFRLEITADTLAQFYADSANALLLVTRGGQNLAAEPPAQEQKAQVVTEAPGEAAGDVVAEPNPSVAPTPPPKKERKPRTPPQTIEAKAEPAAPVEKVPTVVDEDPLGLDAPAPAAKPEFTLADMRQRVQDIITAHGPKTDKNPNARGNEMAVVVPYVRKLFAPFGIKLAAELKPEQFAEFWAASQAYLDGSAA